MTPRVWSAGVPKRGNTAAQNEDAFAQSGLRFAVADGASEGWQSGPWAQTLADAFIANPPYPADYEAWLSACRATFAQLAPTATAAAWYVEEKQQQGAFATLAGFTLEEARDGGWRWRSLAVGDSCLFQVRSGNLRVRFPVESAAAFTNAPNLVGSLAGNSPEWLAGRAAVGDVFYLLTDALAEWFLREPTALSELELARPATFAAWVDALRDARRLKNDDTTALRVELLP